MTERPPALDVRSKVAEVRQLVETARAMPMSTSIVISRAEVLQHLDELDDLINDALTASDRIVAEREAMLARTRSDAEQIVADARTEREQLVSETDVHRLATRESDRVLDEARTEAEELRRETDDYVDTALANFELTLTKTLEAVNRGRERLRHRSGLGEDDGDDSTPVFPD